MLVVLTNGIISFSPSFSSSSCHESCGMPPSKKLSPLTSRLVWSNEARRLNCAPRQRPMNIETIEMETLDHKDLFAAAAGIFFSSYLFSSENLCISCATGTWT